MRKRAVLLAAGALVGFQDSDLDGVPDEVDRCPDTPLLAVVDRWGCPVEREFRDVFERGRKKRVRYYLKLGFSHSKDKGYESNALTLSLAVSRKPFYASYSTRYYAYYPYAPGEGLGDSSLYLSYRKTFSRTLSVFGFRLKLPTGRKGISTRRVSYAPSVFLDYFSPAGWDAFLYASYTFKAGNDALFLSPGLGYEFTDRLYASLSLDLSENASGSFERYATVFFMLDLTDRLYVTATLSKGLSPDALDRSLSVKLGVRF
ncbi:MAG: transporter [Aquificae bacterium]|nr:transporter [Aquificota bacterium]